MQIYRHRVTGRMEDRENKRKGTANGAEMEKEMLATERRGGEQLDGGREREKGRKKKIAMSRRSEGQGKDRRKDRATERQTERYCETESNRDQDTGIDSKRATERMVDPGTRTLTRELLA